MLHEKIDANERLRADQRQLGMAPAQRLPFLCECDDVTCRVIIRLTASEYAEARATPGRSVCAVGHPCDGHVVAEGEGYVVTESD